ncbi:hypothetical protein SPRG_12459 [Saprolegnia parasitica CBS 223.65]|uniref:Uncharacterized protein n=1 Tax=Saprolegnia parasitica (strain CBS 223.65) TaxID=695850 RepID=A0A067BXB0_SAPPC|nr:hypothetical protein SPRG_12459 [Saprolegnia parasitica CBS 223.65]KDO21495.1 hypothetical protein SPRG_12459 [Saprolegnia parasitica CBS 223.65]|eukprot:XP_012207762.1 hypothetical protein SPRG_12459 [Saprolegnia parasitica CBS 223.65]
MARCKTRPACKSLGELMEPLQLAQCAKCHRPIHKAHIDLHMQQCNVCMPGSKQAANDTFSLASPYKQDASPSFAPNSGGTFPALLPMHELKTLAFTPPSRPNLQTTLQVEATRQILFGQTTVAKRKLPKGVTPPTPKRHHVAALAASTPAKPALPRVKPVTLTARPVTLTAQAKSEGIPPTTKDIGYNRTGKRKTVQEGIDSVAQGGARTTECTTQSGAAVQSRHAALGRACGAPAASGLPQARWFPAANAGGDTSPDAIAYDASHAPQEDTTHDI